MSSPALTINQELSIYDAIDFLIGKKISGAPVIDSDNNLVGIISEKDCLKLMGKGTENRLPKEKESVKNFMTKEVISISPDMDIFYVAGIFLKNYYRRLPVVKDGEILGQVSRVDILRGMRDYLKSRGQFYDDPGFLKKFTLFYETK